MKNNILICTSLFLFICISVSFAWDKPQLRWQQLYRYDDRRQHSQLYVNRFSAIFNYPDKNQQPLFKVTPYFEIRRNIDRDLWERKELGIEIGKDISPWLYLGQAIQRGRMKEDYREHRDIEKRDYAESETRLLFSHSLLEKRYLNLEGFILDEYTYDFDDGVGVRNEVAIGLIAPIGKYLETAVNWRHIDRIHYYDSDTVEGSVTLVF